MSDAMSKVVTFDYLKNEIIKNVTSPRGEQHIWMWLTKQPQRMQQLSEWLRDRDISWPANLWPGTSITRQATVTRIASILRVGDSNTVRFVSVEPLLEEVSLPALDGIHLVIVGGESGPGARPCTIGHIRRIVRDCSAAGVSCFVKQLGSRPVNREGQPHPIRDSKGGDIAEFPEDLRVRQWPKTAVLA
jgi:protein gp37